MADETCKRMYLKDQVTGEIFAVAVDTTSIAKPIIVGAKRCTRAEELVQGALPVMPLEQVEADLATLQQLYHEHKLVLWTPPEAPSPIMHKLIGLREELSTANGKVKAATEKLKKVKAEASEIEQQIFAVLATLHEPQESLPFDGPDQGVAFTSNAAEVNPDSAALDTEAPFDSETVEGIEAMAAAIDDAGNPEPADLGDERAPGQADAGMLGGDHAIADGEPEDDPGPDPMDVAEARQDHEDFLTSKGEGD